jgi:K+-transporting ATPase KdpF subunit
MCAPALGCEGSEMVLDYGLGLVLAVLVTAYLVYALVRPERF